MEQSINIHDHTKRLVITALNRHKRILDAMEALGIGRTRLKNLRDHFNLVKIDDRWVERPREVIKYQNRR